MVQRYLLKICNLSGNFLKFKIVYNIVLRLLEKYRNFNTLNCFDTAANLQTFLIKFKLKVNRQTKNKFQYNSLLRRLIIKGNNTIFDKKPPSKTHRHHKVLIDTANKTDLKL